MKTDRFLFLILFFTFVTAQVWANVKVPARDITVNATHFGNNLTNADTDVQKALDTIDDMVVGGESVSDATYNADWNGVTTVAPSKNAVYDIISTLGGGHDAVTLSSDANAFLGLSGQQITVDTQTANKVLASPDGTIGVLSPRSLVVNDIPSLSSLYLSVGTVGVSVEAYDADLAAIAALSGTSGLLKKTATNTWTLDTTNHAILAENGSLSISGTITDGNILTLQNTDTTNYSRIKYIGDGISFSSGVGNSAAVITSLRNKFYIYDFTNAATRLTIDSTGLVEIAGDLKITGDDLYMNTNTIGAILVADGTNFNPVVASGDATIAANGTVTISDGAMTLTELSDVTSATATSGRLLIANGSSWNSVGLSGDISITSSGVTKIVGTNTRCIVMENLAAADDNWSMGFWADAVTISGVSCAYIGTGTTPATITLEDGGGNAMTITGTNPTCVASGTDATFAAVTAGNTLNAGELLRFDVTNAVSPETDEYTICVKWSKQ